MLRYSAPVKNLPNLMIDQINRDPDTGVSKIRIAWATPKSVLYRYNGNIICSSYSLGQPELIPEEVWVQGGMTGDTPYTSIVLWHTIRSIQSDNAPNIHNVPFCMNTETLMLFLNKMDDYYGEAPIENDSELLEFVHDVGDETSIRCVGLPGQNEHGETKAEETVIDTVKQGDHIVARVRIGREAGDWGKYRYVQYVQRDGSTDITIIDDKPTIYANALDYGANAYTIVIAIVWRMKTQIAGAYNGNVLMSSHYIGSPTDISDTVWDDAGVGDQAKYPAVVAWDAMYADKNIRDAHDGPPKDGVEYSIEHYLNESALADFMRIMGQYYDYIESQGIAPGDEEIREYVSMSDSNMTIKRMPLPGQNQEGETNVDRVVYDDYEQGGIIYTRVRTGTAIDGWGRYGYDIYDNTLNVPSGGGGGGSSGGGGSTGDGGASSGAFIDYGEW